MVNDKVNNYCSNKEPHAANKEPVRESETLRSSAAKWPLATFLRPFALSDWPEEESQRPHVTQVDPENSTQLLQS